MRLTILFVTAFLTACTTVKGQDGSEWLWIAPLPSGNGAGVPSGYHSGVTVYTGTVNGRGYSAIVPAR